MQDRYLPHFISHDQPLEHKHKLDRNGEMEEEKNWNSNDDDIDQQQ